MLRPLASFQGADLRLASIDIDVSSNAPIFSVVWKKMHASHLLRTYDLQTEYDVQTNQKDLGGSALEQAKHPGSVAKYDHRMSELLSPL